MDSSGVQVLFLLPIKNELVSCWLVPPCLGIPLQVCAVEGEGVPLETLRAHLPMEPCPASPTASLPTVPPKADASKGVSLTVIGALLT